MARTTETYLTILEDYAQHWILEDGLRELVQNLIDGAMTATDGNNNLDVVSKKRGSSRQDFDFLNTSCKTRVAQMSFVLTKGSSEYTLRLRNLDTTLPKSVLLMGGSCKADSDELIGKFGEGLKTGLVAIRRAGCKILIHNGVETWDVNFKYNKEFEDPQRRKCLHIKHSRRASGDMEDFEIEIRGLSRSAYDKTISKFLMLKPPLKSQTFVGTTGRLLLDPKYRKHIFVKGILVEIKNPTHIRMIAGVDLNDDSDLNLGRDRNLVDDYELAAKYMKLLSEAASSGSEILAELVSTLEGGSYADYEVIHADEVTDNGASAIAKLWSGKHGNDAVPIPHDGYEKKYFVEKILQRKPAFVPESLFNVLATTNDVDTTTTLGLRLRMHFQASVNASGKALGLRIHENERPPSQYRLGFIKDDDMNKDRPNHPGLPPTQATNAPLENVKLRSEERERMESVTTCLVSVLGASEDQILFCRAGNGTFETLNLPVFAEPRLGVGRLVLTVPPPDASVDELHPGYISRMGPKGCWVDFDNGSEAEFRLWKDVAAPTSSAEKPKLNGGGPILCPWNDEKIWHRAHIHQVLDGGKRVQVKWDWGGGSATYRSAECAFFLNSGNIIDRSNIFVNLDALDEESAHKYFGGYCVENFKSCSCIFRFLADATRRSLGGSCESVNDHVFHQRLNRFTEEQKGKSPDFRTRFEVMTQVKRQAVTVKEDAERNSISKLGLPAKWPENVKYSTSLRFQSLNAYNECRTQDVRIPGIVLQLIRDKGHPCYHQYGVFAGENFAEKYEFGQYAGKVVAHGREAEDHKYLMTYSRGEKGDYTIDARKEGNELRFVNDYRGIADQPNVIFDMKESHVTGVAIVVLIARKPIAAGQELLCDYGKEYWDKHQHRKRGTVEKGEVVHELQNCSMDSNLHCEQSSADDSEGEESSSDWEPDRDETASVRGRGQRPRKASKRRRRCYYEDPHDDLPPDIDLD